MFIRVFTTEKAAKVFALEHGGKIVVQYDYDPFYGIVKQYVVRFKV